MEIRSAGFVEGLREAGFSAPEAKEGGYSLKKMRLAGCTPAL